MSNSLFPYKTQDTKPLAGAVPWNVLNVNARSFWGSSTKGGGRVVAVVDTGLDVNHPEFAGRIISPRSFVGNNLTDVKDIDGHGTHVAGIIAGTTCGVAPEARVMPLKVFGNGMTGYEFQDAFRFILQWNKTAAPEDKVVAVNCSWGSGGADTVLNYLIRQLVLQGVGVIAAAGNAGDGDPTTHEVFNYPAYWWECITTGAVDQNDNPAGFTSSFDGVDIGAPGVDIYSAWPEGGYKLLSGTSMATPHVCCAYALICDAFFKREGRFPTGDEAEGILFKHIRKVDSPEEFVGRGLLDLTYATKRWPLYRVQVGAFFIEENADIAKSKIEAAGFPTYKVKY